MNKNALFYPQIGFNNSKLIKAMALYYDNIYRIVPNNVIPDDAEDLQALLEEGSIGRSIDPAKYSKNASEDFLLKINDWDAAALTYDEEDELEIARLHTEKTDEKVRELFKDAGFKEDNNWMYVPTAIASNFMLYLANDISIKNQLSLITSDWGAWTGTSYFSLDGQIDESIMNIGGDRDEIAEGFGLFGLMLNELVPINIAEIPAEKILEFREKRHNEIEQFRQCMIELRNELCQLDSEEIRIDVINDKAKELIKAQEQYKASADLLKVKSWFGVSMMGFPAPIVFGKLMSIPTTSTVILGAAGLAIGGLYNIQNKREELKKLNATRPESFLFELHRGFKQYTATRGGGDMNFHAYNCMEEYVND